MIRRYYHAIGFSDGTRYIEVDDVARTATLHSATGKQLKSSYTPSGFSELIANYASHVAAGVWFEVRPNQGDRNAQ